MSGTFYRFIAFVPHPNVRAEFNKYRRELFASGCRYAFSFPAAAPIALVQNPASKTGLKNTAALFREYCYRFDENGKIQTSYISSVTLPDGQVIAGPCLSITTPPISEDIEIIERYPKLILGAGIFPDTPVLPAFSPNPFRAAAIANMTLRELQYKFSYSWTIDAPHWLPR
ncbi:MAG: hypothetical protein LBC27_06705 [Spirochaetaceae bacterium]|jgi:hypothetical protein|nr:hypothetical protein [Spirochaetaceae bacterium]